MADPSSYPTGRVDETPSRLPIVRRKAVGALGVRALAVFDSRTKVTRLLVIFWGCPKITEAQKLRESRPLISSGLALPFEFVRHEYRRAIRSAAHSPD